MTDRRQFCDACYALFFEQPPEGSDKHHLSGHELKACAESRSCRMCSNLWFRCSDIQRTALCNDPPLYLPTSTDKENHVRCCRWGEELRFTLPIPSDIVAQHHDEQIHIVDLPLLPAPLGCETVTGLVRRMVADTTFTRKTAELSKQWIDSCLRWHAHSKMTSTFNFLPTRLIEVGAVDRPLVRLCETNTIAQKVRYTTLSHRWIEGKIHKLSERNVAAYSEAISPALLSKNFNDAILVTRMLDVNYIWIDSLCIIQDSTADWHRESARMADYYENSYCTLSATASTEFDGGLIIERDPNLVLDTFYDLRLIDPDEKKRSVFDKVRKLGKSVGCPQAQPETHLLPPGRYFLPDQQSWLREVQSSPLNTRGWCYQERLLSSRVLHFCRTRVFFERLDSQCSDVAKHGVEHDVFVRDFKSSSPQAYMLNMKKHSNPWSRSDIAKLTHSAWAKTVSEYSTRKFTFAKDRLVALAGVAQRFGELMSSRSRDGQVLRRIKCHRPGQKLPDYFMGIWLCNEYPVRNLCWSRHGEFACRPDQLRDVVPTWSFASVTSTIVFDALQHHETDIDEVPELATIVEVDAEFRTEHGSEDELKSAMWTGQIIPGSGALWLEGPLLPIQLSTRVIDEAKLQDDSRRYLMEAGTWEDHPLLVIGDEVQEWGWTADALRSGSVDDNHGWSGHYFVIGLCTILSEDEVCGIVSEWIDQGNGCYRRVGFASLGSSEFTAHLDHQSLDPRFYETRTENGRVRIKLI